METRSGSSVASASAAIAKAQADFKASRPLGSAAPIKPKRYPQETSSGFRQPCFDAEKVGLSSSFLGEERDKVAQSIKNNPDVTPNNTAITLAEVVQRREAKENPQDTHKIDDLLTPYAKEKIRSANERALKSHQVNTED